MKTLEKWEPENYELAKKNYKGKSLPEHVYFNKGL